jgi:AraC-like DNA-binding protein
MKEKYVDPIIKSQNLPYLVFDPSKSEAQERIISALSEAHILYKEKKELHEIKIQRLLLEIWELMLPEALEAIRAETDDSAVKSVVRVKKAIDYIEANFAEHITLDELARACGLSRSEFCRCFKRIMNDTPMEYLNKTRIRKSLPLLLSRDYSVTQTAMLSGFSGSSYFSECFRKYMFCSPLEYIKNSKS